LTLSGAACSPAIAKTLSAMSKSQEQVIAMAAARANATCQQRVVPKQ
jgi:hypothetical protein